MHPSRGRRILPVLNDAAARRVVAVGELLWDLLPSGARLGGTTANFALGCARLGRPSALISSVGDDEPGERARRTLAQTAGVEGDALLDLTLIQTSPSAPTGVVDVTVGPGGHPAYNIACPAAWDFIQSTPLARAAAASASAFCFGTLAQRSEPSRSSIRELVLATPADCLRILDMNVREPFFTAEAAHWSLAHVTVAKISDEELDTVARAVGCAGLARGDSASLTEIEDCGSGLLAAHASLDMLAITMGRRGSLLLTRTERHYQPAFPVIVCDTVGAGDAFTAGLVHAMLAGASLGAINQVSNLCGSFVASQQGATPVFPASLLGHVGAAIGSHPAPAAGLPMT